MGGAIHLEDPMSFEAHFNIDPAYSVWKKIGLTTLNWLDTNRNGMTFGVLMGTVFLTMFRYIKRTSFKSAFANSFLGLLMGTPLGVCVNCAAPIAKGMYDGGARAETTLSTMIASPTLNIVVLSMLFGLLPFYMALGKVVLCIGVIILAVPLICWLLPKAQLQLAEKDQRTCLWTPDMAGQPPEYLGVAVREWSRDIATDFWYIFKLTVPLMILAGFLGAIVATLVPLETFSSVAFGLAGVAIVALFGLFLPVPIAFDVVICAALLAAGVPPGYVMTLLFTLGVFSIYSAFIVSTTISIKAALYVSIVVWIIGILAGVAAQAWHEHQTDKALDMLLKPDEAVAINILKQTTLLAQTSSASPVKTVSSAADITLTAHPFAPRSPSASTLFTRGEAHTIGLDQPIEFSFKDMWPPFWEGRGITSGDIDRDGDLDIIIASTEVGFRVYLNDGTGQFLQDKALPKAISDLDIFNVALVDLDNDGWLDLFLTTYMSGNYVIPNREGALVTAGIKPVINRPDTPLTLAASFGDVDQDGDLDLAAGNWAAGWYRRIPGEESRNRLIFNDAGQLSGSQFQDLSGLPGETLTILFSDIDRDGHQDLLVGNDFELPDVIYYGEGEGKLRKVARADGVFPHTTNTTMAIKSDDLDNDLVPELYFAQIAGRASGLSKRLNMSPIGDYCDGIGRATDRKICERNIAVKRWYKSGNSFDPSYARRCLDLGSPDKEECQGMLVKDLAIQARDPSMCRLIPRDQSEARAFCDVHFRPIQNVTTEDVLKEIKQIDARNVLLSRSENGTYTDKAIETGLEVGGWSWDTKVGDFDNDEWQDMVIVNGTWVPTEATPANLFFRNRGDGRFVEDAIGSGMEDYLMTAAATRADFDNDGDLDIVTVPVNGPLQVYQNNSQDGNIVSFSFDDRIGNRDGVGNRVTIFYGEGRQQVRELQLGGGFMSFDAAIAHFGLGEFKRIDRVIVNWADGGQSEIAGPVKAGSRYIITRQPQ
ncbi:FG-GAP-like repeat-containing protein [Robiginitomaculum antarcticum]|uniref:FG-GAP-like repeat-containing protein n=1 Tax=Robiginitomaculum antarcticum TaxID=437507 RepID=UPI0003A8B148|nr:FG-GAP-like repeat-containing protein [Robiginitomaculum antarcticum]